MRRYGKFATLLILILWICLLCVQGQPRLESIHSTGYFLRIDSGTGWTEQASIPLGATASLVVISPIEGNGCIYEIHPDGKISSYDHYFLHRDSLAFCADTIGRHELYFGRDFSLGMINNNYPGTPFQTQFLSDP
jgi:hypothetical protein